MDDHAETVARILADPRFAAARETLEAEHERTVEDIVRLTEIASPPFGEAGRAEAYRALLQSHGLAEVEQDAEGNVMGLRRGTGNGAVLVVAAHLDTVFPEGTAVTVRREGTKLHAPGIGDDTRSLAVLLAWMRALDAAGIRTRSDILFVGDVGEEGAGDLRGMRHLFQKGRHAERLGRSGAAAFISVDSPDMTRMATGGVGSKRYRVVFSGPGGHSFGAFGTVSPMYAMAQAAAELGRTRVPVVPRTTYSASVVGGGTSVNAIPGEVWLDVDLRSESPDELGKLDTRLRSVVDEAVTAENRARATASGAVRAELRPIGDRPGGQTDRTTDLVRFADAAMAAHGFRPAHVHSSTDANLPMSLGIPAIQIGSGGSGDRAHSLDEWIDVEKGASLQGMVAGLATVIAVAGLAD